MDSYPGLCDCCASGDATCFCLKATCLPCLAYGQNYALAISGPDKIQGGCCTPCCMHCVVDAILPTTVSLTGAPAYLQWIPFGGFLMRMQQRIQVVSGTGILGSCLIELFCYPCSLTQVNQTLHAHFKADPSALYTPKNSVLGFLDQPKLVEGAYETYLAAPLLSQKM